MAVTMKITRTEGRLFLRDPLAVFFGLVFPSVLLLALGLFFPGFKDPVRQLDGLRYIDVYAPITLGLGVATLGLVTLPPILGGYRQFGILRRLRTTPVHPRRLLLAQMIVHGVIAALSAVVAIVVAVALFDLPVPERPLWFVASFILSVASIFAVGLLIGALARAATTATAVGMGVYFPMLFFGGVWIARGMMPDGLRTVSDYTPLGSAVQAMQDSWLGSTPSFTNIAVMAAYAAVLGFLAVRLFRWE
jgi:ABC-2 type transport system permease protein